MVPQLCVIVWFRIPSTMEERLEFQALGTIRLESQTLAPARYILINYQITS